MTADDTDSGVRLADLVAAFSLATDLGLGQPMEHVQRSWLIARRLAGHLDLGEDARASLFYVMMLAWVGCVAVSAAGAARPDFYRTTAAAAKSRHWTHRQKVRCC